MRGFTEEGKLALRWKRTFAKIKPVVPTSRPINLFDVVIKDALDKSSEKE